MDILADVEEISRLQAQLQEAHDDLSNKDKILMDKEKELSECKDRVTALEDQLVEYATTIQEQSKVCGVGGQPAVVSSTVTASWVCNVVPFANLESNFQSY